MVRNIILRIIDSLFLFLIFFLTFYIGFDVIGLKHNNILSYMILVIISGCFWQLYVKAFEDKNKEK